MASVRLPIIADGAALVEKRATTTPSQSLARQKKINYGYGILYTLKAKDTPMNNPAPTMTPDGRSGLGALILAAGKGTRMHSDTPKVLQSLLEEPMLAYVYKALAPVFGEAIWTVVGHRADMVRAAFPEHEARFVLQERQLGTGHALVEAWPRLLEAGLTHVLVTNGDTPLISEELVRDFLDESLRLDADLVFAGLVLPQPGAFGRVVRKDGKVAGIVEAKDYDSAVHGPASGEINAGVYCLRLAAVGPLLPRLGNDNKSGEFYITDLVGLAVEAGLSVEGLTRGDDPRLLGINSPEELARSETLLARELVRRHLREGAIIRQGESVRLGPDVRLEPGADITGPCEIYGKSAIGRGARIASHCRLHNAVVEAGARVHSFSHIQDAHIGPDCIVGPYARLRPGAVLEESAHVGNFVEMKKARLGKGAKANHLTYLGDAEIGAGTNIGAGTITCNYDGRNKHQTIIGEKAFIGSNVALVAPVRVGDGALVGAGSVITKPVEAGELALTRAPQRNMPRKK
jgi:bifunctional UDP-N-acetylglucosamine pyrophosphorylase/glucosamine-1-phosphate N-acetyltransferase